MRSYTLEQWIGGINKQLFHDITTPPFVYYTWDCTTLRDLLLVELLTKFRACFETNQLERADTVGACSVCERKVRPVYT